MPELPVTYRTRPWKRVLVAFGAGIFVWIGLWLLPRQPSIALASLFRKHFVAWSDVQLFVPVWIQFNSLVGWNYLPAFRRSQRLRGLNTAIAGVEAALPDTYGMSAEQLAKLMNQLRDTYANAVR